MSDEEDYPEVGDTRHGMVLVCQGDDKPQYWIDWLEPLINKYEELNEIAEEYSLNVEAESSHQNINDWKDFCEAMGISIDSAFWEGSMISGHYKMGWIKARSIRRAEKTGEAMLKKIRQNLFKRIREQRIKELNEITDLDVLVERTRDDRDTLLAEIDHLKAAYAKSRETMNALQHELTKAKVKDAPALSLDCLRIAGAVLNRERVRLIAGPLVLWDDGVVYALTSRGNVTLPDDSSPALLLKALQQSGHPTVEVSEMTVIGGWTSGPIYRKGSVRISGWINVWHDVEQNRERVFVVADPDKLTVVRDIHEHFKIKPAD